MTVPTLVAMLALQAISDPDVLPVLGDAVLESGMRLYDVEHRASHPTPSLAWDIAARALFEPWPKMMLHMPVVVRCWRPNRTPLSRFERVHAMLAAGLLTSDEAAGLLQEMESP